jgi:hypothetical protein
MPTPDNDAIPELIEDEQDVAHDEGENDDGWEEDDLDEGISQR